MEQITRPANQPVNQPTSSPVDEEDDFASTEVNILLPNIAAITDKNNERFVNESTQVINEVKNTISTIIEDLRNQQDPGVSSQPETDPDRKQETLNQTTSQQATRTELENKIKETVGKSSPTIDISSSAKLRADGLAAVSGKSISARGEEVEPVATAPPVTASLNLATTQFPSETSIMNSNGRTTTLLTTPSTGSTLSWTAEAGVELASITSSPLGSGSEEETSEEAQSEEATAWEEGAATAGQEGWATTVRSQAGFSTDLLTQITQKPTILSDVAGTEISNEIEDIEPRSTSKNPFSAGEITS